MAEYGDEIKIDENSHMTVNSNDNSLFISTVDKTGKIDNANEGFSINYPSINKVSGSISYEMHCNFKENYLVGISQVEDENKNNDVIGFEKSFNDDERNFMKSKEFNYKESNNQDIISENNFHIGESNFIQYTPNYESDLALMKLFTKLFESRGEELNGQPYFFIVEKCEVKDLIVSHKVYEILYFNEKSEKTIKCYRRYDNFHKLHTKLKRKYPYILIPRLPPKNPLAKIITIDNEFYENRRRQLNFYINYLLYNNFLFKTKEVSKFINDAEFDEEFFNMDENPMKSFPHSLKVTETVKNKIFGVFTNIFWNKEESRKVNDNEILLKRMETHYKRILEKYTEIKENVVSYIKTLKNDSEEFGKFSNTCFYLKDTLENVPNAKESFKSFYQTCVHISEMNKKSYELSGRNLQNKFMVKLNIANLYKYLGLYIDSSRIM
jgi:hypothetical protein